MFSKAVKTKFATHINTSTLTWNLYQIKSSCFKTTIKKHIQFKRCKLLHDMAVQVSKKIFSVLVIAILFTMMFSSQISHSYVIDEKCVKDCIVNICMKASTKATATICTTPCQKTCDPLGNEYFIVPRAGRDPIKTFCQTFSWVCGN